ncbi:hypothetical protein SAMN05216276_11801, partial [Streptosporangium subroseum]
YNGEKSEKAETVATFEEYDKLTQKGYVGKVEDVNAADEVGPSYKDAKPVAVETDKWKYEADKSTNVYRVIGDDVYGKKGGRDNHGHDNDRGWGNNSDWKKLSQNEWPAVGSKLETKTISVTKTEYDAYKGLGYKATDGKGNYTITSYFTLKYTKNTKSVKYTIFRYFIKPTTDAGRLGDNVGGQGFTWNQKAGQTVYTFGYPASAHPDGNKAFTGVTPKWCYGKTLATKYVSAADKVEEHVGLKCSMTSGADGAPWLVKYSSAKRLGYVNGVTSLFGDTDKNGRIDVNTSAYFDGETAAVYNKAAAVWSGSIVTK